MIYAAAPDGAPAPVKGILWDLSIKGVLIRPVQNSREVKNLFYRCFKGDLKASFRRGRSDLSACTPYTVHGMVLQEPCPPSPFLQNEGHG